MSITSTNPAQDILKFKPELKPNSITQYVSALERLQRMFNSGTFTFLSKPDNVLKKINDLNYLTQRNYLNAIIVLLSALNKNDKYNILLDTYGKYRDTLNQQYIDEQATGVISEKQSPNFATTKEIYQMLDQMATDLQEDNMSAKQRFNLLQAYTIFSVYSRTPFRNDLAGMILIDPMGYSQLTDNDKRQNNYLVFRNVGKKLYFILNNYKTSRKYEELVLNIDDPEVQTLLRNYIDTNNIKIGDVLFRSSLGKVINRNELSKLLIKYSNLYMNKNISTTLLRKIFLSSKYGTLKEQMDELEKDNRMMMHSKDVALSTYIKKPR